MVNPNVLKSAGIDPDVYTSFAFGVGMERTLLLRNSSTTCTTWSRGDVRFAEQFVMGVIQPCHDRYRLAQGPCRGSEGLTYEQLAKGPCQRWVLRKRRFTPPQVTGPIVVGYVVDATPEPQKNGKTINWCHVDCGDEWNETDEDGNKVPRGIICGAPNMKAGERSSSSPARCRAARRLQDRTAQDLRLHLQRHVPPNVSWSGRQPQWHHPAASVWLPRLNTRL